MDSIYAHNKVRFLLILLQELVLSIAISDLLNAMVTRSLLVIITLKIKFLLRVFTLTD
ncbi:MAG: hypothetical protein HGGPFJEG_01033 [Ignavibacteria bacterium]|nr:hypothetical protein [Ignavibacteria bacterium]